MSRKLTKKDEEKIKNLIGMMCIQEWLGTLRKNESILVLTPTSNYKYQWVDSLCFYGYGLQISYNYVFAGTIIQLENFIRKTKEIPPIIILTYTSLTQLLTFKTEKEKELKKLINWLGIRRVLFDESDKIVKQETNATYELVKQLVMLFKETHIKNLIGFSGTVKAYEKALLDALNNKDKKVREIAIRSLRLMGEEIEEIEKVVLVLIEKLMDNDKDVRIEVASVLGRFGVKAEKAKPHLKKLIDNEQNSRDKFEFAFALIRIEKKRGEGTRIIEEMKEKRILEEWQIRSYDSLCQELKIQDKVKEVKKGVNSVQKTTKLIRKQVEEQPEDTSKELLGTIKNQETTIAILQKTIEELIKQLKEKKLTEQKIDELIRFQRGKLRSEIKIKELQQEFFSLLQKEDLSEKGKALEMFCVSFFSEADGFEVTERSLVLKSEEIDLILKNNARKPYWIQLRSPNIFVECKNWSKPVGADEIKKFRMKIYDHQDLVKVGFFIALNGFTTGLTYEQIRAQTSGYVLGVIIKEDFEDFFNSEMTILEFLEYIIYKSIK